MQNTTIKFALCGASKMAEATKARKIGKADLFIFSVFLLLIAGEVLASFGLNKFLAFFITGSFGLLIAYPALRKPNEKFLKYAVKTECRMSILLIVGVLTKYLPNPTFSDKVSKFLGIGLLAVAVALCLFLGIKEFYKLNPLQRQSLVKWTIKFYAKMCGVAAVGFLILAMILGM
ncbi:MAG: hypothetical protein AB1757_13900 [Acidobacteriota bacterium]